MEKVQQLGHPDATKVYTEQLLELHRGQGMEIYWRDNFLCPEESEYKLMTILKTGGLFMLAIRLMLLFCDNKKDFTKLTALLGKFIESRSLITLLIKTTFQIPLLFFFFKKIRSVT